MSDLEQYFLDFQICTEEDSPVTPRKPFLWVIAHSFNFSFHLVDPYYLEFFHYNEKKIELSKKPYYDIFWDIKKWRPNLSQTSFLENWEILSVWQLLVHIIHAMLILCGYILFKMSCSLKPTCLLKSAVIVATLVFLSSKYIKPWKKIIQLLHQICFL